jgi:Phosphoinositide phospholipase C, Ca2+-dependent
MPVPARIAAVAVAAVAVAATVSVSALLPAVPPGPALPPAPALQPRASSDDVRMNQIQFMGAHNGYHREMQGAEFAEAVKIDPGLPGWASYSHAAIPDLLGRQHVRHVELDLLPDPAGGLYRHPLPRQRAGLGPIDDPDMAAPGMKVQHVPDVDYTTSCRTFVGCLTQVRDWSRANPGHVPVVLQLELKQTDDRWEQLGGAVSPPWDASLLDAIDAEIRSVFTERELITADDVRRPGRTLEQSILTHGWPKLSWARGKVLFFFDNVGTGSHLLPMYLEGHPNLEGRAAFPQGRPGDTHAAVTQINDPRGANLAAIQDLVRRGYLVRTRSDEPFATVKNEEFSRVRTALDSGAQVITTDFPTVGMGARWDSDFVAELPGGAVVRCNPVSAPSWCRDRDLERR